MNYASVAFFTRYSVLLFFMLRPYHTTKKMSNSLIVLTPLFVASFLLFTARLENAIVRLAVPLVTYTFTWCAAASLLVERCFLQIPDHTIECYRFFTWASLGGAEVGFSVWIDHITIIMTFAVLTVSICVQLFSLYYMVGDPHFGRFFLYLSLFTFCMLLLVASEDLLQLFVGWEAVGLCSYILINFWYTRIQANKAAMKAILVNRIGDFGLFIAICLIFVDYGTLNIYELSYLAAFKAPFIVSSFFGITNVEIICFCLFIAVMSKSAQFGLHTWLPDAMEGPTPVSALIHAATMVTAGIYLMLRTAALFVLAPRVLVFVSIIGSLTMIFGATTALAQNDIKKVIAFSTCSQLGYMVAACGLAQFSAAFFHLITHAFFKALLFLCAGVIIHSCGGEQDIRNLGGLRNMMPLVYVAMSVASFSLMGIPFLSGYYSKEFIIGLAFFDGSWHGFFIGVIAVISAVCTSLYSLKLITWLFWSMPRQDPHTIFSVHAQLSYFWLVPLVVLSTFSVISGYYLKEILVGVGSPMFPGPMAEFVNTPATMLRVEWAPDWFKVGLMCLTLNCFAFPQMRLAFELEYPNNDASQYFWDVSEGYIRFYKFFHYRWCLDLIYSWYIVAWSYRSLNWLILQTAQHSVIDPLTFDIYVKDTESGSQLIIESNGITPRQYLFSFMVGLVVFNAVFILLINPEALYYHELEQAKLR